MFLGSEAGQKSDLITKISACQKSRDFFRSENVTVENFLPEIRVLTASLRCLWLTMAPEALHCEDKAAEARNSLVSALYRIDPERAQQICKDIMALV
jgi:hypothetical protein